MDIRYPPTIKAQEDGTWFVQSIELPDTVSEGDSGKRRSSRITRAVAALLVAAAAGCGGGGADNEPGLEYWTPAGIANTITTIFDLANLIFRIVATDVLIDGVLLRKGTIMSDATAVAGLCVDLADGKIYETSAGPSGCPPTEAPAQPIGSVKLVVDSAGKIAARFTCTNGAVMNIGPADAPVAASARCTGGA